MKHNYMEKNLYLSVKLFKHKFKLIPKLLWMFNRVFFSCDIPFTADIDSTVRFGHNGLGIVINKKVCIGKNCLIMQHTTLAGTLGKKREIKGVTFTSPIIGEHTFIGAGAILLGPIG